MIIDKKIKILILIDVLTNIKGGAERQVYELIRRINKENFEVYLFILHQKEIPGEINDLGIEVKGFGIEKIYNIKGIFEGIQFANFLRKNSIDILITYHFGSDIWGTIFGSLAGVPVIISNRRDTGFWRKKIHIRVYKIINKWVDKIIVVSKAVKETIIKEEALCAEKIEVIYSGVDSGRFKTNIDVALKKKELGLPLDCKVIGSVGNLRMIKGHKFLIEAAHSVVHKFPNAHFLLVGDGELKEDLNALTQKLNLKENIHFLGKRSDVPELIKITDICVLPSLSEGLSNSLLEYMAAGKPVVATSVGGNTEVIEHNKNGILVPASDSRTLAAEIIKLLENRRVALNLGIKAKEAICEKFNLENQIKLAEHFLVEELANKKNTQDFKKQKKEIRVIHLISSGGLFGAEKVMLSLASNMNQNGIKSWVVAIKNFYNAHLEVIDEAKKRNIPNDIIDSKGRLDLETVSQLVKMIKQNNINLIHSHNYKAHFLGMLAAKKARIPIIATNHLWNGGDLKLRFYEFIDGIILGYFVNKVIAVSNSIKKDMLRMGVPNSKIEVIFNGIEIKNTNGEPLNNELKINKGATLIGVVARLSQEKGHRFLLEAMKEILKHNSNINLLIVGEGNLKETLKRQVGDLGISEKVIFAGYQNDMHKIYPIIDIIAQPSLNEGLPITLLEAMTFGKPIVATDVGGVGELIKDGVTGLLIKPASSKEITRAVLSLLANITLRERIGENARSFVMQNYSIEIMVNRYKSIYRQVANLI